MFWLFLVKLCKAINDIYVDGEQYEELRQSIEESRALEALEAHSLPISWEHSHEMTITMEDKDVT